MIIWFVYLSFFKLHFLLYYFCVGKSNHLGLLAGGGGVRKQSETCVGNKECTLLESRREGKQHRLPCVVNPFPQVFKALDFHSVLALCSLSFNISFGFSLLSVMINQRTDGVFEDGNKCIP